MCAWTRSSIQIKPCNRRAFVFPDRKSIPALPTRASTLCPKGGCGRRVAVPGYCANHQKEGSGWSQIRRSAPGDRGYGWAWKKLRARILERDSGLCQVCLSATVMTRATAVDHIKAKAIGGTDDEANLQAICRKCHTKKTNRDKLRSRKK